MKYVQAVSIEFDAGHQVHLDLRCAKSHGHHWIVTVSIKVSGSPAPNVTARLRDELDRIAAELERRDLEVMMPATLTTVQGVANWFWDRLVMDYQPVEVRVTADGESAIVSP